MLKMGFMCLQKSIIYSAGIAVKVGAVTARTDIKNHNY